MSKKSCDISVAGRRKFLTGVTLTGAAALAAPAIPTGAQQSPSRKSARVVPQPNLAAETQPPAADPVTQTSSGGDFMVEVFKTLDIDYLAMNCASSFRGLHEAVINYGKNVKPEILTCPHEEIAVSMAQGYAKIEGKPMAMICHGTVGLQHATMAMYNSWCDRVPVYVMIGNIVEADKRAPGAEWVHSAIDPAALVRDFVKWDDQPASLQHFAESAVRAYKIATTPPMGPVLLSLDAELQENPIADRACDRQSVRRGFAGAHPRELSGEVLSIGHHAGNDRLRVHLPEPACGARLRATRGTAGRSDRREDSRGYAADLTM